MDEGKKGKRESKKDKTSGKRKKSTFQTEQQRIATALRNK